MAELNEAEFYNRRERQERMLAKKAIDPAIASIHLDMADQYASLGSSARKPNRFEGRSHPHLQLVPDRAERIEAVK